MGLFKKKNQQTEQETKDPVLELKQMVLEKLNTKLNGTLYDDCVSMPKGFTSDVHRRRSEEKYDSKRCQGIVIGRSCCCNCYLARFEGSF